MKYEMTEEETRIFGHTATDEEVETFYINAKLSHIEMDEFFKSLPDWVSEGDMFSLWMKTDNERKAWLEANAPVVPMEQPPVEDITQSPYMPPSRDYKPTRIGNVRI